MQFSIVTPSFRQLPWLKRCVRSVADQEGVEVEHLIQDGGTGPELEEWVRQHSTAILVMEPDAGMYDAINKGLLRATGEVCGILNCDEQYLSGTLARVAAAFAAHPEADMIAGDYLVVDSNQQLLAFRKVTPLRPAMILTDHLYAFTCALFFRRSTWERVGPFDTSFKSIADGEWVARALTKGHRAQLLSGYVSTFTWTGENLSAAALSREEDGRLRHSLPFTWRVAAPLLRGWRHLEKWRTGAYRPSPVTYEVYEGEEDTARSRFTCERPRHQFPRVCGTQR